MNAMDINAMLAMVGALIAAGTLNRMSLGTSQTVRLAMVLIFIGLLGQSIGVAFGTWEHFADTLLFGGIAAFTAANRRIHCGIPTKYMTATSLLISGVTITLFIAQAVK